MKNVRWIVTGAISAAVVLSLGGCPTADPRTSNQGGGSLISAGQKLANEQLGELTADEWQIVSDFAIEQSGQDITPLSDEQAQAIVNVLVANNVNSIEDFQTLLDNPEDFTISDADLAILEDLAANNADTFTVPAAE